MLEGVGTVGVSLILFIPSVLLTAGSIWLAARLAPWFVNQRIESPSVASFFLEPSADMDPSQIRMTTLLLATAILLAVLTPLAAVVRFGGFVG